MGLDRDGHQGESQTEARIPTSIQFRVIQELLARPSATAFDVIFDDDGTGEVADIVAVRDATDGLHVHLYHCKYSGERQSGARVGDLYEVCGQAQRSIRWSMDPEGMFRRLLLRENQRVSMAARTRAYPARAFIGSVGPGLRRCCAGVTASRS